MNVAATSEDAARNGPGRMFVDGHGLIELDVCGEHLAAEIANRNMIDTSIIRTFIVKKSIYMDKIGRTCPDPKSVLLTRKTQGVPYIYNCYKIEEKVLRRSRFLFCSHCSVFYVYVGGGNNEHSHPKSKAHEANLSEVHEYALRHTNEVLSAILSDLSISRYGQKSVRYNFAWLTPDVYAEILEVLAYLIGLLLNFQGAHSDDIIIFSDGWTDGYRFEAIVSGYIFQTIPMKRLLYLAVLPGMKHDVKNLALCFQEVDKFYSNVVSKAKTLSGDSTALNPALARELEKDFSPCTCHQNANAFNRFVSSLPQYITNIGTTIGKLRKQAVYTEYLKYLFQEEVIPRYSITNHISTRWFSFVDALERFVELYVYHEEKLLSKPELACMVLEKEQISIISVLLIPLKKLRDLNKDLERDTIIIGKAAHLLDQTYRTIASMRDYEELQEKIPNWNSIVESYMIDFRKTLFDVNNKAYLGLMVAGHLFHTSQDPLFYFNDQYYYDEAKKIYVIARHGDELSHQLISESSLVQIYLEHNFDPGIVELINQEYATFKCDQYGNAIVPEEITSYKFFEKNEHYPGYFCLMRHFITLPFSNASVERIFSTIKGIHGGKYGAKSIKTIETQSFIKANVDLAQLILVNQFPEMMLFLEDEECKNNIDSMTRHQIHKPPEMPPYDPDRQEFYDLQQRYTPDGKVTLVPVECTHYPYISSAFPTNSIIIAYRRLIGMCQKYLQIDFFIHRAAKSRKLVGKYDTNVPGLDIK